ncbi:MAG: hypothetical protein IIY69_03770, partial [Clostridia bacterium]|nr:hypothetical protein [Clostridia bacterium]
MKKKGFFWVVVMHVRLIQAYFFAAAFTGAFFPCAAEPATLFAAFVPVLLFAVLTFVSDFFTALPDAGEDFTVLAVLSL